MLKSSFQQLFF